METPELDKRSEFFKDGTIPAIQEFLEWLDGQQLNLMRWSEEYEDQKCTACGGVGHKIKQNESEYAGWSINEPLEIQVPCRKCDQTGAITVKISEGWVRDGRRADELIADHLGYDLNVIESEHLAILAAHRELNK